jgi:predicted dehydrogenase/threonine dehydrogenase-like Zn-dependent dehydrogenase
VTQNYRTGAVEVLDVPPPALQPAGVVVRLATSLISAGTERGKVELARKSLLGKAQERPEALRQVLDALRREGPSATLRRIMHRLDRLTPIGYSAAGTVVEVATDVRDLRVGDRVAVGGGGYANHAELVWIPRNLAALIPNDVTFEQASFATVGSIALHGLRATGTGLGDTVAVIGLGLVGQLAARLARAAGCRVVGCDLQEARIAKAGEVGIAGAPPERFAELVHQITGGLGADAVLLTAASRSAGPLRLAAQVARERAQVVAVGATGLDVPREAFYRKELSLTVSRSYGPGRYDMAYEQKGRDYPPAYVRWTEGRNLVAVLMALAAGDVEVDSLVSHRVPVVAAAKAYELLLADDPATLGIVLQYPDVGPVAPPPPRADADRRETTSRVRGPASQLTVGLIGSGSFASNVLVPALKRYKAVRLVVVASASSLSATDAVRKHGFARAARDGEEVIADPAVDAVFIVTPHHLHAPLAAAALMAGKAVFVEKPLAISWEQLTAVSAVLHPNAWLMVGFNRRFSPHVQRLRARTSARRGALVCGIRVNAGAIPSDAWVHDPETGGGRLVGEGCHFFDLAMYLVGARPTAVRAVGLGSADPDASLQDNVGTTVEFADGSVASVLYTAKGDPSAGKERIEVFCDGWTGVIDNFDRTEVTVGSKRNVFRRRGAKGHGEEIEAFVHALLRGEASPIGQGELLAGAAVTLAARDSLMRGGAPQAPVISQLGNP